MKNCIVTCLTYKRKQPKILNMLKRDPKLIIYFGVRKEEYEAGFYDEWMNNRQIRFLLLENCVDASDTRQKILDACYALGYKYVVQLDDTVSDLKHTISNLTPTECIEHAIRILEDHPLKPIGFEFVREGCSKYKTHKAYIQAWLINIKRLHDSQIRFRPISEVGWDDFVFSWEVHNAGFYTIMHPAFIRVAKSTYPWANEPGGTHVNDSFQIDVMIQKNNIRCIKAKAWLKQHYNATNVSIRKLTSGGKTFDYVHAEWPNK